MLLTGENEDISEQVTNEQNFQPKIQDVGLRVTWKELRKVEIHKLRVHTSSRTIRVTKIRIGSKRWVRIREIINAYIISFVKSRHRGNDNIKMHLK